MSALCDRIQLIEPYIAVVAVIAVIGLIPANHSIMLSKGLKSLSINAFDLCLEINFHFYQTLH